MSSPVPDYIRYRYAVALNNIGVSLMEKQCYQQAIYTLKDSITLFRDVVPSPSYPTLDLSQVKDMLATAWQRAAQPKQSKSLSDVQVACYEETNCHAKTIFEPILRHIAASGDDHVATLSAIYISSSSHSEDSHYIDRDRTNYESALAMYNFGVAHVCLAKQAKQETTTQKLYAAALKLFSLTRSILQEQENKVRDFTMVQSELPLEAWLDMVVLGCMAYTWVELDNFTKAKTALLRLARFVSEYAVSESQDSGALAAAAA
jgi:hypothetical protein